MDVSNKQTFSKQGDLDIKGFLGVVPGEIYGRLFPYIVAVAITASSNCAALC